MLFQLAYLASLAALLPGPAAAQSTLTTCPTPGTNYTVISGSNAAIFNICPNSDYQATTLISKSGITSASACVDYVYKTAGSTRGVFDKKNNICHVKSSTGTLTWLTSTQYDSFKAVTQLASGSSVISKCPFTETNITNSGSTFSSCPNSYYSGQSYSVSPFVSSSSSCANLCASSSGCAKASFDKTLFLCYLHGNPTSLTWVFSTRYEAIRKLVASSSSTTTRSSTISSTTSSTSKSVSVSSSTTTTTPAQASSSTSSSSSTTVSASSSSSSAILSSSSSTVPTASASSSTTSATPSTTSAISSTSTTTSSSSVSDSSSSSSLSSTSAAFSPALFSTTSSLSASSVSSDLSNATSASDTVSPISSGTSSFVSLSFVSTATPVYLNSTSTVAPNATSSQSTSSATSAAATPLSGSYSVDATILVIASNYDVAKVATSGLNAYGIPFQTLLVPSTGTTLPTLAGSAGGNFGGIIVVSQVSYDYGATGYASALTSDQWNQLFAYQITYGVRMVQYDVYPGPAFGTTPVGACCGTGVEQTFSFSDTSDFAQAGLAKGAGVSTIGIYHYGAAITNFTSTKEIAQFAPNAQITTTTTAAVINNFDGRQQMAFFIPMALDWSPSSAFMQHAYITWLTRGLYAGYRRVNFGTQIDDMFLDASLYYPANTTYRVVPDDMKNIAAWVPTINAKMNTGSSFLPELGHNGNGNVLAAAAAEASSIAGTSYCGDGGIELDDHDGTALEFIKPLGTGTSVWPLTPTTYRFTKSCINQDPLMQWFNVPANRDAFTHISHTFSHGELNNSTYQDALKEIQFNQAWFQQTGISKGKFTSNGLIPPAITGLHNGDVIRAWSDAGLSTAVGDNSRPVLRNPFNRMWALTSNQSQQNFDGYQIIPRFSTRIYFNCDTPICTLTEWINTSAGSGDFSTLLSAEKFDTTRQLMGLMHDAYMFHQANLRTVGLDALTINGVTGKYSIFQAWVETIVAEFNRLVNWPMVALKQDDLGVSFANRQARDNCGYKMSWNVNNGAITDVTVTTSTGGNSCSAPIPVTVPGSVSDTKGFMTEKLGNDPLTVWVQMAGQAVSLSLSSALTL